MTPRCFAAVDRLCLLVAQQQEGHRKSRRKCFFIDKSAFSGSAGQLCRTTAVPDRATAGGRFAF